jgi:hypothetical protein
MHRALVGPLALAMIALATHLAAAQSKKPKASKPATPYGAQISAVHEVRTVLEHANHDYKGHRAKAVGELNHAIHHLYDGYARPAGKQGHHPRTKVPAVHELQALSDAQLQQAAAAIVKVGQSLGGAKGIGPGKAVGHLNNAVKELKIALSVSPKIP